MALVPALDLKIDNTASKCYCFLFMSEAAGVEATQSLQATLEINVYCPFLHFSSLKLIFFYKIGIIAIVIH
jgi:hypothetical protein